jgi:amidase
MDTAPGRRVGVHPDCASAVGAAGRLLEGLGHQVEPSHPTALDDEGFARHAPNLIPFGYCAFALERWERRTGIRLGPDDLEPWTWTCAERGRAINAGKYLSAVEWIQAWSRRMATWWAAGLDVLLTPTLPEPPPPLGSFTPQPDNRMAPGLRSAQVSAFTFPFNMTGQPALSLPLYWSQDGLPVGVQLIAPYGRDDLLLQLASQLARERSTMAPSQAHQSRRTGLSYKVDDHAGSRAASPHPNPPDSGAQYLRTVPHWPAHSAVGYLCGWQSIRGDHDRGL